MAYYRTLLYLVFLALTCISMALLLGNHYIALHKTQDILTREDLALAHTILFHLRLPRVLTAFITGGLLALSGALMQVLVRNPLADPYILGISSAAGLSTLLFMLFGVSEIMLTGSTFAGSFIGVLLVFLLTKKQSSSQQLLLTGIALASGFSALMSLILLTSSESILRGMLFWLVGDLGYSRFPLLGAGILAIGLLWALYLAKDLNLLVRGENPAKALGVNTLQLQWHLYVLSSLLTATAVTLAGCIGFIGLIVPHMIRLKWSYDHRFLLPACVLLGGSLLTLADFCARTLFFPQELPVGLLMVLLGIPVFLFLLQKNSL